jgi:hypothetical protein
MLNILRKLIMSSSPIVYKSVTVDTTNSGTTLLFTDYSVNFAVTNLLISCSAATNVSQVPTITIGVISPTYNDILDSTVLTGLTSAGSYINIDISTVKDKINYDTGFYINVTSPSIATIHTINVNVEGQAI